MRLEWVASNQCVDGSRQPIYSYFSIYRADAEEGPFEQLPVTPGPTAYNQRLEAQLGPDAPRRCYRMTATGSCPNAFDSDAGIQESGPSNVSCIAWDAPQEAPGQIRNLRIGWSNDAIPPGVTMLHPVAATTLVQVRPTTRHDQDPHLVVAAPGEKQYSNALIRFDLSGVTEVRSAILRLYASEVGGVPFQINVHPVRTTWSNAATWNSAGPGAWQHVGAMQDFESPPVATIDAPMLTGYIEIDVTEHVQTAIDTGVNEGWHLKPDQYTGPPDGRLVRFAGPNAESNRLTLQIER